MKNVSIVLCSILVASCSNHASYNENIRPEKYNLKSPSNANVLMNVPTESKTVEELQLLVKQAETEALNSGLDVDLKKYREIYKELAIAVSQEPKETIWLDDYSKAISAVFNGEANQIINRSPKNSKVHFEHNSSFIKSDTRSSSVIETNALFLKTTPEARVMLAGFADLSGDAEYNLWLGKRRAANVAKALVNFGVNPEQISIVSYGDSFSSTDDISSLEDDRRVDFVY